MLRARAGAFLRLVPLFALAFGLSWLTAPRNAEANCTLIGVTVICTGNSPAGFTAGAGVNGLTVNVQSGATVGTGITLNDSNTVGNLGTVSVGDSTAAITANDFNTVANSGRLVAGIGGIGIQVNNGGSVANSGTITVGDSGFGILVNGNNASISNSGTIRFGDCGTGISAFGSGMTVTNTGSLIGTGCGNTGIQVGDSSSVINNGLIQLGDTGTGISGGTGTTIVNNGTIIVGIDGIGMSSSGNMTNTGTVILADAASTGFTFGMAGTGNNLRVTNSGTITGGANQTGIFIVGNNGILSNSGTITIGSGGAGIYVNGNNGTLVNGGTVTIDSQGVGMAIEGNNGTASNSGILNVANNATGIAILGSGNTVRNTGTINLGSCAVGIDTSTSGSSNSTVINSGRIVGAGCSATGVQLRGGDSLTNSGVISAPFSVVSTAGSGAAVTNSGILDGRIDLRGTGGNSLTNSGMITVGTALAAGGGTPHLVRGSFVQTASGTLALRVGPAATATNFDTFTVTGGTATLGGRLRALVQPGLYGSTTVYAGALTFSSSTGTFAGVDSSAIFFTASAVYNAGSVDLVLSRIPFSQFGGGSGGGNARAVGNALEAQYSTSLTGTAASFYSQLLQSTAPNTLSQLSGEVASAGQNASFGAFGQLFGTVFGQINTSRTAGTGQAQTNGGTRQSLQLAETCTGDACDEAPSGRRLNYWAQGFGAAGSYDANGSVGSTAVNVTSGGGATGIDVQVGPNFLLGAMLGSTSAGFAMADLASTGTSQAIVFGVYSSFIAGAAYLDTALAYGYGSFTTQRYVGTGSLSEQVSGAFGGNQYGGRVEGGWRFQLERHAVTPYANLTVQALQQNAYTEVSRNTATGAPGLTGLNVQGQTTTSVRSVLGAEFATYFALAEDTVVRPRARLGWAHEFNTYRASTASFAALGPGVPFTVQGASPASDALVVQAAVEVELGGMLRIYGQFDGDFANAARSYAGTGGVRLRW